MLGGAGGIHFWLSKWFDRIRIKIRIIEHDSFIAEKMESHTYIKFEIENIGGRVTSLDPIVKLTTYSAQRKRREFVGMVKETDRNLQPHKARVLTVDFPIDYENEYIFLIFHTYKFGLTRGFSKKIRMWSISGDMISERLLYYFSIILFKLFNIYIGPKT